jgi:ArsR family transcriptional regulator
VPKASAHAHSHARPARAPKLVAEETCARAAALFRALGDVHRLRLIEWLSAGERCVSELAESNGTKMSTLSQQLRVLRQERIVKQRRDGKHVYYSLADAHVRDLVLAALQHVEEG